MTPQLGSRRGNETLTIRRPDDWHVHLRDGDMLKTVAPYTARQFARAIVMPNLAPPMTDVEAAKAYRERITAATGPGFTPLMTCYLTDGTDPTRSRAASRKASGSPPSFIPPAPPPTAPAA